MSIALSDSVRDVLSRSTITGMVVTLPEQLDRAAYMEIDKALKGIGGKWDRKAGGHVFPFDPSELLAAGVEEGKVEDRVQTLQFFQTPSDLAKRMVEMASPILDDVALEPSAGHGRIVLPLLAACENVTAVEIDRTNADTLGKNVTAALVQMGSNAAVHILIQDFLTVELGLFDVIVMNPPFTRGQDIDHIQRAYSLLAPGGRLVSVLSMSPLFRTDKRSVAFREWIVTVGAEVEDLEDATFRSSGTDVRASLLRIVKP